MMHLFSQVLMKGFGVAYQLTPIILMTNQLRDHDQTILRIQKFQTEFQGQQNLLDGNLKDLQNPLLLQQADHQDQKGLRGLTDQKNRSLKSLTSHISQ